jgi:hypothetical protein
MVISTLSTEYVTIPVTATSGGSPVDLSGTTVEWAFTDPGAQPSAWHAGDWLAGKARILVGPAVIALAVGYHDVWLRVTDSPEIPVRRVGQIKVY